MLNHGEASAYTVLFGEPGLTQREIPANHGSNKFRLNARQGFAIRALGTRWSREAGRYGIFVTK